jgi:phosphotransferase system  glucose/maltose/N-acetylglucosamine-specific IIC component
MMLVSMIVTACIGVYAHWLKSWLRETITSSFIDYMVQAPKHTGAMLFTLAAALVTGYQTGMFTGLDEQSLTIAFMAGFTADSTVNKES